MIDQTFVRELLARRNPDGGFPFHQGDCSYAEPTIFALLAQWAWGTLAEDTEASVAWCRELQNPDGSVGLNREYPDQGPYCTALFTVLCHRLGLTEARDRAVEFLLKFRSITFDVPHDANQLNSRLVGWPWAFNTFSWVEPTAWALIALRLAGKESHSRAIEGREILKDRWIADKGWNLGNKIVYGSELIPFLDTTALAVLALSDQEKELIEKNLDILARDLPQVESFYALSWIGICLKHYGRMPDSLPATLSQRMKNPGTEPVNLAHLALGCLALADKEVFHP